ncbi:hypothetical protein [Bacillus sp. SG-1]|uniref:hypothetical protein n=1 Tax=Bacillus sp. SG-1 TaxID=161544 RepID=UPI0001543892|nr:hypothetical protein [Bacillus sp. SG-1]EDL65989.1 hypothetical protein BSG1_01515 [Bacillus sp. SG-1]
MDINGGIKVDIGGSIVSQAGSFRVSAGKFRNRLHNEASKVAIKMIKQLTGYRPMKILEIVYYGENEITDLVKQSINEKQPDGWLPF